MQYKDLACPYCGGGEFAHHGDDKLVTYWGVGDALPITCDDCEKKYYVQEAVTRTYTVTKEKPSE